MNTHTPGPWHSYQHGDTAAVNPNQAAFVAGPTYKTQDKSTGFAVGDAALIAAAPDMLAALRNVQKLISEAAMTGFNCHDGDWAERLFHSQQMTSAAIDLATGKVRNGVSG